MYEETLPKTYYKDAEQKEIQTMYMGTESKAKKDFKGITLSIEGGSCLMVDNNPSLGVQSLDLVVIL